ncbi:MAG: hypothetical protein R3E10_19635 [Gemmatimonadota bacterium]
MRRSSEHSLSVRPHGRRRVAWGGTAGVWGASLAALAGGPGSLGGQAVLDTMRLVDVEVVERARHAPLFQTDSVLEFTLTADFGTILREDRRGEPPRRPARLSLGSDTGARTVDLQVQTRGEFRRNPANCRFPPLWLDFERSDPALTGTPFEAQNRIKLYVTCRPGNSTYEEYLLEEYLLYRLFNRVTDLSYRARLARVTYEDASGGNDPFTSWAFVLEDVDDVAARHEGIEVDAPAILPAVLDGEPATRMELFLFMIGTTDFSAVYSHNVRTLRLPGSRYAPLPYDFDMAGIINASYATVDPRLGIKSVQERVYRGFCRDRAAMEAARAAFLAQERAILTETDAFDLISEGRRRNARKYLEEFFDILRNERRADRWIFRGCQTQPS